MSSVKIALVSGVVLTAVAIGVTLAKSPVVLIRANGAGEEIKLVQTQQGMHGCQSGETVPGGTSAIRVAIVIEIGPAISLTVSAGNRVIARGSQRSGWAGGGGVTISVSPVAHTTPNATVCFTLARPLETLTISGAHAPRAVAFLASVEQQPGRVHMEYVRQGPVSWFSLAPSIAERMGLGHAWAGVWIVFVLAGAMGGCTVLLARSLLRELG